MREWVLRVLDLGCWGITFNGASITDKCTFTRDYAFNVRLKCKNSLQCKGKKPKASEREECWHGFKKYNCII